MSLSLFVLEYLHDPCLVWDFPVVFHINMFVSASHLNAALCNFAERCTILFIFYNLTDINIIMRQFLAHLIVAFFFIPAFLIHKQPLKINVL